MQISHLQEYIREIFDPEKFDAAKGEHGYIINKTEIHRIGYCANLTPETIEESHKNQIDMIITHHDAWDFIYGMKAECEKKLSEYNISHLFVHLPLDGIGFGNNAALMEKIGAKITGETSLYGGYYCGRIGELETPVKFRDFAGRLSQILGHPVRCWKNNDRDIKKICVATGGGFMTTELRQAADAGADVYITGEAVLYSILYSRFKKMNLITGSHTFTEIFGVENLAKKIQEKFRDTAIMQIKEEQFEFGEMINE